MDSVLYIIALCQQHLTDNAEAGHVYFIINSVEYH